MGLPFKNEISANVSKNKPQPLICFGKQLNIVEDSTINKQFKRILYILKLYRTSTCCLPKLSECFMKHEKVPCHVIRDQSKFMI